MGMYLDSDKFGLCAIYKVSLAMIKPLAEDSGYAALKL